MVPDQQPSQVLPESLITVLGVVYAHQKTADGGDLYLTSFGMQHAELLAVENWYDREWFNAHRQRLDGTSAVYRVPTKPVNGISLDLVVKNCRVGEDVPADTRTLLEFINAEFNSPWEEFSLTMELREGRFGDPTVSVHTQEPLAIYVPSETMQVWQSGRSVDKIRRIKARHPGIDIDILKQYKLVYGWIHGKDLVECMALLGVTGDELMQRCTAFTAQSIAAMDAKGFAVADIKPSHVIVSERHVSQLEALHTSAGENVALIESLMSSNAYSIVDYELLCRTPGHEKEVFEARRSAYLDDQRDRFVRSSLPSFLKAEEIIEVPYVFGHTESTGGSLWVVGHNGRLFDYFLPERWRRTHAWKLSENNDIFYTITKDRIHLVWKISRVGETPQPAPDNPNAQAIIEQGFNSPFEEFAIAHDLAAKGVGAIYVRAIYMTGTNKVEASTDKRRYDSHSTFTDPEGTPILRSDHDYVTLRGYFNGPDSWVAARTGALCRPLDLAKAIDRGLVDRSRGEGLMCEALEGLCLAGYDGSLLAPDDFLLAVTPEGNLLEVAEGKVDIRICNFEFIKKRR